MNSRTLAGICLALSTLLGSSSGLPSSQTDDCLDEAKRLATIVRQGKVAEAQVAALVELAEIGVVGRVEEVQEVVLGAFRVGLEDESPIVVGAAVAGLWDPRLRAEAPHLLRARLQTLTNRLKQARTPDVAKLYDLSLDVQFLVPPFAIPPIGGNERERAASDREHARELAKFEKKKAKLERDLERERAAYDKAKKAAAECAAPLVDLMSHMERCTERSVVESMGQGLLLIAEKAPELVVPPATVMCKMKRREALTPVIELTKLFKVTDENAAVTFRRETPLGRFYLDVSSGKPAQSIKALLRSTAIELGLTPPETLRGDALMEEISAAAPSKRPQILMDAIDGDWVGWWREVAQDVPPIE